MATRADGYAEREAAKLMIAKARQAVADPAVEVTLGANKGYDAAEFIKELQRLKVTPHVAQNKSGRSSAVPGQDRAERRLRAVATQEEAHRTGLRMGEIRGPDTAGHGARHQEGRAAVRPDDGCLQPRAHAHLGRTPSNVQVGCKASLKNRAKPRKTPRQRSKAFRLTTTRPTDPPGLCDLKVLQQPARL
jgi:hypothetical protein